MVKVVGQDPSTVKKALCKNCGAILEYNKIDVKEYHGVDYSGGSDGKEWIDCPQCNTEVILKAW